MTAQVDTLALWYAESKLAKIGTEEIDWIRSRPPVIQDLILSFPPRALVRSKKRHLLVPRPGKLAVVYSYFEDGLISVLPLDPQPTQAYKALCEPDWLEVVDYWGELTPDRIREIINDKSL